jgi:hypothetical protein
VRGECLTQVFDVNLNDAYFAGHSQLARHHTARNSQAARDIGQCLVVQVVSTGHFSEPRYVVIRV